MSHTAIPTEVVEQKIFLIRKKRVMFDKDLAQLYGVRTKNLNKAVKRNIDRFPEDFMFQISAEEFRSLRFQSGTLKRGEHAKYLPYVFTEQGIAMLSSVLHSPMAIQVNIAIMRAFVKLREVLSTHKELAHKFEQLEHKVGRHDKEIQLIFEAIRKLMTPPKEKSKPRIGFTVSKDPKRDPAKQVSEHLGRKGGSS